MTIRLRISNASYALLRSTGHDWIETSALRGAAGALLDPERPADERGLESAIEIAEDWLMPQMAELNGQVLEVEDLTGRLSEGLAQLLNVARTEWKVDDIEADFLRLVEMATGLHPYPMLQRHRSFIADILLLRELAHHGSLSRLIRTTE